MNELEQQGLVLRQLAALRRRGVSMGDALELASEGVPEGRLRSRLERAIQALATGAEPSDELDRLLAGDATAEALEIGAAAAEAHLTLASALSMVRWYGLAILIIGSLCGLALTLGPPGPLAPDPPPDFAWQSPFRQWAGSVAFPLQVFGRGGLVFGVGCAGLLLALARRRAPGVWELQRAAGLIQCAATGQEPDRWLGGGTQSVYYRLRRESAGPQRAGVELAGELTRIGLGRLEFWRALVSVGGVFLLVLASLLLLAVSVVFATGGLTWLGGAL